MNKNKERLEEKIIRAERLLEALANNKIDQAIVTDISELLLDYKNRLKKQREVQKRITPEKRLQYVRKYRAKQKLQSNIHKDLEDYLK